MKRMMTQSTKLLACLLFMAMLLGTAGFAAETTEQTPAPQTTAAPAKTPFLKSSNDKVSVSLYGQVNRAMMLAGDGESSNLFHVDNDNSSTRFGLNGKAANMLGDVSLGTRMEFEFQHNASNEVNQTPAGKTVSGTLKGRHFDIFATSKKMGKLSMGYGSTASDGTAEVDLSGTTVIGYSSIADMAGGHLFFNDAAPLDPFGSGTTVGNAFSNMDGLGRQNRIRYDSPEFYGVTGSLSHISAGDLDIAVRYAAKFGSFKLAAAAAYADADDTTISSALRKENILDGSVSMLHDTGFSGTIALGRTKYRTAGKDDAGFFYLKGGYQAQLTDLGKSAFAVDLGFYNDVAANSDEGTTIGLMAVQNIDPWATEAYAGYRFHKLDRSGPTDFNNINALMVGARVKF